MAKSKHKSAGYNPGHGVPKSKTNMPAANAQLATAVQYQRDGRLAEAQAIYTRMLAANPRDFIVLNNLGLIAFDQGRDSDAEVLFKQAVSLNNRYVMPLMNLGNLFQSRKNYSEAISYYEQALQVDSSYGPTHVNLGNLLTAQGKFKEAVASYHRALAISPDLAEAYLNLGNALVQLGRSIDAVPQYERARSLQPGNAGAHIYLGVALLDLGQLDQAKAFLQQGLQLAPDNVDAWVNLGTVFTALGLTNESVQCFRRALELSPDHPGAQSNLLSCLNYCDSLSPADVAQESRHIGAAMEGRFIAAHQHHANKADPGRRLRIGYVSPDFRRHAVAFFLAPLFRHDRAALEIFCYSEVANPDQVTQRFQSMADHWFSSVGVTDDALAARIQKDGIDILIDLAGHTNHNRLPVFARRPAPVQITWLGYPNTTGLKSMDYRLVDSITDLPGVADQLASETLIRLDGCFICYDPPEWAPAPMPPPSVTNGFVTFGSFNNLAKLSNASLRLWAALLMRMPSSRLLLKSRYFVAEDSKALILARLQEHGIAPERVMLLGPSADADQLAAYHHVDIALDSLPYNGTTTTCEALWMGVPVVTLAGESHCSRVGASLLTHTGLSDLIARDQDDYIRIAAELAGDPARLARLRQELRARVAASPLCDASAFACKLEAVYRTAWNRWCGVETPTPKVRTTPVEALPVRLSNDIVLAVPPSLDAITTYVALEQEAWFEKEADFPSLWLKPGMTAIDIGASLGIYSLPMARAVGPSGHVFAYEPGGAASNLLEHSRDLNHLANLTVIRAALSDGGRTGHLLHGPSSELHKLDETGRGEQVTVTCLDNEDRRQNWTAPDFVKIDAQGEEGRILRGGASFFSRHSPLVMFALDNDVQARASTCEGFRALGYRLYRLLPGAPVLVPDSGNALDAYELNLFAAKPDQAAALARDGWLVEALPNWHPGEVERQTALQPLRQVPSAAAFADLLAESRPLDPSYRDCLAGFAAWRSPDLALPVRCAALEFALAGLLALNTQATTHARLLTLARVAWEAGKRALSVQALRHFLTQAKPGLRLEEPFWPPSARFDRLMPVGGLENWIIGSVTEQIERGGHYSSYYTGLTAGLEWLSAHPSGSAEMERRRVLVRARAGERTEVSPRLRVESSDHLNAPLWQAARIPNTSVPQPSVQAAIPVATEKQATPPKRFINVALNRPASQSSTSEWSKPNDPGRAVSGTCTGTFAFCTAIEAEPFWSVDLQSSFVIRHIAIYNREDSNPERACPLTVETSVDGKEWREIAVVKYVFGGAVTGAPLNLVFAEPIQARYVRLRRTGEPRHFHLDQVEIHASTDDIQSCARIGEDLWVLRMTGGRSGGAFVEIGSSDGVTANNTCLLEARFGWRGVCVEPNPAFYQKLAQNRTARTFQRAVFRNTGDTLQFVPFGDIGTLVGFEASDKFAAMRKTFMQHQTIQVETISPNDLFAQGELPSLIDFLSLDTEGSEWDILESIDFSRYNFALMAIEHNYVADKREMIYRKLKQLGYNRFDAGSDDWYYHPVHLDTLNKNIQVDYEAILNDFRMQSGFGKEPV